MIKVLFVCLGNICRSPMAEAVFRDQVSQKGLSDSIRIDSAGTGDWHIGHPPHQGTQEKLQENNISFIGIKGRQISLNDFDEFDYIVAMDHKNKEDIESLMTKENNDVHIMTFMSFLNNQPYHDVPDPYFTGNFDEVYDLIDRGTQQLLQYICEQEDIQIPNVSQ